MSKNKQINIFYHFPQYESLRIVLCHYDLCWFLVVYGFDKSTWTWKWQDSAIPGKKLEKPSRTPEEVSQAKKQYKQKRSRFFNHHWTTDRPWLLYDEHEQ